MSEVTASLREDLAREGVPRSQRYRWPGGTEPPDGVEGLANSVSSSIRGTIISAEAWGRGAGSDARTPVELLGRNVPCEVRS